MSGYDLNAARRRLQAWRTRRDQLDSVSRMPPNVRNEIAGRMAALTVRQGARQRAFSSYVNRFRSRRRSYLAQMRMIQRRGGFYRLQGRRTNFSSRR